MCVHSEVAVKETHEVIAASLFDLDFAKVLKVSFSHASRYRKEGRSVEKNTMAIHDRDFTFVT